MRNEFRGFVFLVLIVILSCGGEGGSVVGGSGTLPLENLQFPEGVEVAESFAGEFWREVESDVEPGMPELGLPVEKDEIFNLDDVISWAWLGEPPPSLLENGFLVYKPNYITDNPIYAYEHISSSDQPVYVSAGIPLHMLHIFFDQILQSLEEDYLYADLETVCRLLYERNIQREFNLGAAYFAVPLALLDPSFQPDPAIVESVEAELRLIQDHAGFEDSPVFGYREDYSQYVPRGHYTASEGLKRYFKSMMWLGRLTFLLNGGEPNGQSETYIVSEDDAKTMTACALLIVSDLNTVESDGEPLLEKWRKIYEITAFFAGFADDLSVPEYSASAEAVEGGSFQSGTIWETDFYYRYREYVNDHYSSPAIYSGTGELISMPDEQGEFDPGDLQDAFVKTTGFRFLGQRYTPDSEILGKLVFPSVGANSAGENRYMPTGLDVAAVFGSEAALDILRSSGDFEYSFYGDSVESLRGKIEDFTPAQWHSTLYMSWLHCLYLLQQEKGDGYPDFMRTEAWKRHTLSNFLASWAMLRHDTILYAKQSYTMQAGCAPGPFDEPVPSAGFVEPVPEVYAELRATLEMAQRGLISFDMFDSELEIRFRNAVNVLSTLQDIAQRELRGEQITPEDADFLKGFASYLESAICFDGETSEGLETSLIADVHTDQNSSSVLEVASGNLDFAIVLYRRPDGHAEAAIGPVLSYYEFTWPMSDRLTDEAWREILEADTAVRPWWIEVEQID